MYLNYCTQFFEYKNFSYRYGNSQNRLKTRYGPWAVVTGASSGIGHEMALRLAEAGLNLVLVARSQTVLEQIAKDLRDRYGIGRG